MKIIDVIDVLKYFNFETHKNKKHIIHYNNIVEILIILDTI